MSDSELTMGAGHGALMEESPYGMQSKKLAMWLFIASDAVTFAVALVAYGYLRIGSPNWTRPFDFWPSIANGMVMTFVLLSSSLTMLVAVRAAQGWPKTQVHPMARLHHAPRHHLCRPAPARVVPHVRRRLGTVHKSHRWISGVRRRVFQRHRASPAARDFWASSRLP